VVILRQLQWLEAEGKTVVHYNSRKKKEYSVFSRVLTKKATVFPVPVLALASTSFPIERRHVCVRTE
jgi:hypothetical protein